MTVSYKKLWKLLIDKDMKKQDLRMAAKLSSSSVAKLSKGENVNTDILVKICKALNCDVSDIMEILPDEEDAETPKQ
jgi:DNA-binding Xre family transcriptional regulator